MNSSNLLKTLSVSVSIVAALALLAYASMAHAAGPTCTVPGDYATIQAAVNDVGCTTINVGAGTYAEHVAVNRAVILNGANAGTSGTSTRVAESIVDGTDTDAAFAITANNVTINGFTVENGSNGGFDAGIWSQSGTQNSNILNNIITQNAFGVWAQCGGGCLIQGNLFDGNNKPGTGAGSASVSADSTTGLTINNNEFKNDTAGNPILLQATAAGAHASLVVSNNNFHDNAFSNIYAIGIQGGNIHDNTITPASDATGISFSGANANVTVTKNVISGGARGVRVEDAGFGLGANSAITVNRNNVSLDSTYGVGNTDAAITNLDATCNWWGSATGPGPVGSGTGSPVTINVTFSSWLTTSDLDGSCNGAPPSDVTVTIVKDIDGVHATSANAATSSFPMNATWNATNIGSGSGSFSLGPVGFNNPNPYEATTANMTSGASYSTNEDTSGSTVGASCSDGKPFALVGYTTGDSLAAAQAATASTSTPAFTNITTNKWVVVWNHKCPIVIPPPPANACATPTVAPAGFTLRNGTTGSDVVTLAQNTMFVGRGGNDVVKGGDGNFIVCTSGGNDLIKLGNGDFTIDAGGGNNNIQTGNGNGSIATGAGNDNIKTGDGAHTINAGGGNNAVTTGNGDQNVTAGNGNDSIKTGDGNDTINAGGGNNSVKSGGGDDTVTAGSGNDSINGGAGTDSCSAGGGFNSVINCSP